MKNKQFINIYSVIIEFCKVNIPSGMCRSVEWNRAFLTPASRQGCILFSLFLFFIITAGCRNDRDYKRNCIDYVDSLRINLSNGNLQVAFIKPELNSKVRPYAFVYDNHLIVLNKQGVFYTFTIDCLKRDTVFEKKLNLINFKRAFVLENSLYGVNEDDVSFQYNELKKNWDKIEIALPFGNATPVYEDEKYVCYSVCHGEFGGAVFFYNKTLHQTTFFPANCLVSVMKKKDGYYIISNLAHGFGGSSITGISNPDSLYKFSDSLFVNDGWKEMHEQKVYKLITNDTTVNSESFSRDFRGSEKLISSGFIYKDNYYFLTQMGRDKTYLTKLRYDSTGATKKIESILEFPNSKYKFILRNDELDTIPVPDSIFYDLPASRGEITCKINDITIINYRYFDTDDCSEEYLNRNLLVTTFLQRDSSLIRIDWPK